MSGLTIKVAALLFNILLVQGNIFQEEKYLQDGNHIEHYQSSYSDYKSDNFGKAFKRDWRKRNNAWRPQYEPQYPPSGLKFGAGMPSWFPAANPMGPLEPIGPIGPTGPMGNPTLPIGTGHGRMDNPTLPIVTRPGRLGFPNSRNPERNGRSRMCQNIKGLPTPESGCCGVQLTRYPVHQQYPSYPNPAWPLTEDDRFRRSAGSDNAPNKMIRGGKATDLHQLPWMVRLAINSRLPGLHSPEGCGGTIISSRYILTAAHCVHNTFKDLEQLEVFLAEYDTDQFPRDCIKRDGKKKCIKNIVMQVEHVIIHKNYNDTYLQNDVALLRLTEDIPYTQFIRPICLPPVDVEDLEDSNFVIAGWGLNGKKESNLKQAAVINYVANDKCKEQYSYKDDSLFCSIGGNGEDICHGDSGGPLMAFIDGKYYLSGVVNGKRSDHECGSSVPSLFNNVFYHRDWIVQHVK